MLPFLSSTVAAIFVTALIGWMMQRYELIQIAKLIDKLGGLIVMESRITRELIETKRGA